MSDCFPLPPINFLALSPGLSKHCFLFLESKSKHSECTYPHCSEFCHVKVKIFRLRRDNIWILIIAVFLLPNSYLSSNYILTCCSSIQAISLSLFRKWRRWIQVPSSSLPIWWAFEYIYVNKCLFWQGENDLSQGRTSTPERRGGIGANTHENERKIICVPFETVSIHQGFSWICENCHPENLANLYVFTYRVCIMYL